MTRVRLAPDVRSVSDEDGAVLLNLRDGRYYGVNRLGAQICAALTEGANPSDLVEDLLKTYNSNADTIRRDVEKFLGVLRSKQMLLSEDDK